MINRTAIFLSLLIPVLLVAPACRKESTEPSGTHSKAPVRTVSVATATQTNLEKVITVFGSFLAQEKATLSTKVPGRLETVQIDLGTPVKAGTPIAQIESRDYDLRVRQSEAALAQALARLGLSPQDEALKVDPSQSSMARQATALLDEARASRDRISSLHKDGVLSQSELDTAEAAFTVAENRYRDAIEEARQRIAMVAQRRIERDIAAQQFADTTIKAPFDATVQERAASPGEYLNAGDPVATLIQVNPLRLRLEVSERDAPLVSAHQLVRAQVEGFARVFSGPIVRVSPAIDQQRRVLLVEADIPNEGSLHPGMFARAVIVVNPTDPAITIPAAALVTFAGIEKVYIVAEGTARERVVTSGRRADDQVEVVENLKAGEQVILDPGSLQNGQPVTVSPAPPVPSENTVTETGKITAGPS